MVRPSRSTSFSIGPRPERGIAAVYGALSMVATISATALAVDIGQLYYAQRDLQKMASDAALNAARAASGCFAGGAPTPLSTATTAATSAINQDLVNAIPDGKAGPPSFSTVTVPYGYGVSPIEYGQFRVASSMAGLPVRAFQTLAPTDERVDSVRVNLARLPPTLLVPFLGPGGSSTTAGSAGTLLRASATAQFSPVTAFHIDGALAALSVSTLCPLLAQPASVKVCVATTAVNNGGLAQATITLDNLAASLGIADAGHLLNTPLNTGTLLDAIGTTLTSTGDGASSAAGATIHALAMATDPSRSTTLATVLGVVSGATGGAIGTLPVNVSGLLDSIAASSGSGFYPVTVPVAVNLPGVSTTVLLSLGNAQGDPSKTVDDRGNGMGRSGFTADGSPRTSATTSQVKLMIRVAISSSQLPVLSAVVGDAATVNIGIDATAASAAGFVSSINCAAPISTGTPQPGVTVNVTTSPASVQLGAFDTASPATPVRSGSLITLKGGVATVAVVLKGSGPLTLPIQGASKDLIFTGPFNPSPQALNETKNVGFTSPDLATSINTLMGSLGGNLTVVVTPAIGPPITLPGGTLVAQLTPILSGVVGTVVPLLSANGVGIALGDASVRVTGYNTGTTAAIVSTAAPVLYSRLKPGLEINPTAPDGVPLPRPATR